MVLEVATKTHCNRQIDSGREWRSKLEAFLLGQSYPQPQQLGQGQVERKIATKVATKAHCHRQIDTGKE